MRTERQDLKDIREALGLTQVELAARADVSPSIVSRLESGRFKTVSPRIARKLGAVYGIPFEQINGRPVPQPSAA